MNNEAAIDRLISVEGRLVNLIGRAKDLPRDQALQALAGLLDEISLAFHDIPDGVPAESDPLLAPSDWTDVVAGVRIAFPELDYYRHVAPTLEMDAEPVVGSAVDDLSDILRDIEQIRQRIEAAGVADAARYARQRWPYTGAHLTQLRRFLHYKLFAW
jgi:hypothetical protein